MELVVSGLLFTLSSYPTELPTLQSKSQRENKADLFCLISWVEKESSGLDTKMHTQSQLNSSLGSFTHHFIHL